MKYLIVAVFGFFLLVSPALGGEVYGTITDGSKPIAAGIKVTVTAGGQTYSTETDKFGSYRLFIKQKGKFTLTVQMKENSPSIEGISFDKSTRYDWILETKDARTTLRRK